jgi:uncharacterized protein YggE
MEVDMLKRVALGVVAIAVMAAAGLAGVWLWGEVSSPEAALAQSSESGYSPAEIITVVGQGSVFVPPDIARVSIGVESSGETVSEAVALNEEQMEAILEALDEAGIEAKDIQTMNYSIQLERYPEVLPRAAESAPAEPKPAYRVTNMVNVIIRDLESVSAVLDAVVEAGANSIWGLSFSVDDPSDAQAEARAKASEDALARAEALAELSGVELGPVMSVSEVVGAVPAPMALRVESATAGGPISPGELEIGFQVQVSYFIER